MKKRVKLANYLIRIAPLMVLALPSYLLWGEPEVPKCLKSESKSINQ